MPRLRTKVRNDGIRHIRPPKAKNRSILCFLSCFSINCTRPAAIPLNQIFVLKALRV